jgi:hypothetical protein
VSFNVVLESLRRARRPRVGFPARLHLCFFLPRAQAWRIFSAINALVAALMTRFRRTALLAADIGPLPLKALLRPLKFPSTSRSLALVKRSISELRDSMMGSRIGEHFTLG